MHKDQKHVQNTIIPSILARALAADDPAAERDCTILARMFRFGADPLFLMEAAPGAFTDLCRILELPEEKGKEAIEKAHWMGPATLLGGGAGWDGDYEADLTEQEKCEVLWLFLADNSDCVEDGYGEDVTLLERICRAFHAAETVNPAGLSKKGILQDASEALAKFKNTTEFTFDDAGHPHSDQDHSFYVAYKTGYKVCCVHTPTMDFWGTTDATTLEEQGVKVDKPLSPHFGIVFHKE